MTSQAKPGQGMDRHTQGRYWGSWSVCFQRPGRNLEVRVGREEEGISSLRPELAAIDRTLQATSLAADLLYLCDSEAVLSRVSKWIGERAAYHAR